jgi:hypothetical protein
MSAGLVCFATFAVKTDPNRKVREVRRKVAQRKCGFSSKLHRSKIKPVVSVFSFVLILLSVVLNLAARCPAAGRPQAADPIKSIRRQYANINKRASRYRKVKKQLSGFSLEAASWWPTWMDQQS